MTPFFNANSTHTMKQSRSLTTQLRHSALAVLLLLTATASGAQTAGEGELARKLDQLAAELAAVKAQLQQLQQRRAAPPPAPAAAAPTTAATTERPSAPATVLSSYGEINTNRPTKASQNAQADLRRFVLGLQHRFDAKTKVVAELEEIGRAHV